ncbi:MAG: cupredoxin domain-containing protein [bacterium]
MHIDATEKKWVYLTFIITFAMIGILTAYAITDNINPPSNVETVDSVALHMTKEFAEDNLGVKVADDGSVTVVVVAARYGFFPQEITVPANKPVKFRIASADVLHGIHTAFTNLNTMVVPGFVSEITTTFPNEGDYPMFCNEYCGLGHDHMWSRLHVVPEAEFNK